MFQTSHITSKCDEILTRFHNVKSSRTQTTSSRMNGMRSMTQRDYGSQEIHSREKAHERWRLKRCMICLQVLVCSCIFNPIWHKRTDVGLWKCFQLQRLWHTKKKTVISTENFVQVLFFNRKQNQFFSFFLFFNKQSVVPILNSTQKSIFFKVCNPSLIFEKGLQLLHSLAPVSCLQI